MFVPLPGTDQSEDNTCDEDHWDQRTGNNVHPCVGFYTFVSIFLET